MTRSHHHPRKLLTTSLGVALLAGGIATAGIALPAAAAPTAEASGNSSAVSDDSSAAAGDTSTTSSNSTGASLGQDGDPGNAVAATVGNDTSSSAANAVGENTDVIALPCPQYFTGTTLTDLTDSSLTLDWTMKDGAPYTHLEVWMSGGPWSEPLPPEARTFSYSGDRLKTVTNTQLWVVGFCSDGSSSHWSQNLIMPGSSDDLGGSAVAATAAGGNPTGTASGTDPNDQSATGGNDLATAEGSSTAAGATSSGSIVGTAASNPATAATTPAQISARGSTDTTVEATTLAQTGSDTAPIVAGAGLLAVTGAIVLLLGMRRRTVR